MKPLSVTLANVINFQLQRNIKSFYMTLPIPSTDTAKPNCSWALSWFILCFIFYLFFTLCLAFCFSFFLVLKRFNAKRVKKRNKFTCVRPPIRAMRHMWLTEIKFTSFSVLKYDLPLKRTKMNLAFMCFDWTYQWKKLCGAWGKFIF